MLTVPEKVPRNEVLLLTSLFLLEAYESSLYSLSPAKQMITESSIISITKDPHGTILK